MTPALCGPAADDQMLRSQTMCHVAAVLRKSRPSAADQMHQYVTWLHGRFVETHTRRQAHMLCLWMGSGIQVGI